MKYCKIHNQKYMDWLTDCPICVGEKIKPAINIDKLISIKKETIKPIVQESKPVVKKIGFGLAKKEEKT